MAVASSATSRRGWDNMWYTYVLVCVRSERKYIGVTNDLRRRFQEHNKGVGGTYTKNNRPFRLVFYEAFLAKKDAEKQEKFYKSGYGREVLNQKLEFSLKD